MGRPKSVIVTIAPAAFGTGFDVVTPDATLSRELPTIAMARAYADDIAIEHDWAVDDRSGER